MRAVKMMVIGMLYSGLAFAAASDDDWLCKEESSQRRAGGILACGIGTGSNENEARTRAFEGAQAEFDRVCSISDDCRNHVVFVDPKRTVCRKGFVTDYTCYRLVAYEIGEVKVSQRRPIASQEEMPRRQIEQTSRKLRIGMTKKQLLAAIGYPDSVDTMMPGTSVAFLYSGSLCHFMSCSVIVDKGRVKSHYGVRPEFTDVFE